MQPLTEIRIIEERQPDIYEDIINKRKFVVNINNLTIKEEKAMLENEKSIQLEQLNWLKGEYETKLAELKTEDVNSLIETKVAEIKETIATEVLDGHNALIAKTELKLEAINEMIADVEAVEVEVPAVEAVEAIEEVPAENAEV